LDFLFKSFQRVQDIPVSSKEFSATIGFNSEFDKWNLNDLCANLSESHDMKDSYQCSNLMKNYDWLVALGNSIYRNPSMQDLSNTSEWFYIHEVVDKYICFPQNHSTQILEAMLC
jgi:hypothetical protein